MGSSMCCNCHSAGVGGYAGHAVAWPLERGGGDSGRSSSSPAISGACQAAVPSLVACALLHGNRWVRTHYLAVCQGTRQHAKRSDHAQHVGIPAATNAYLACLLLTGYGTEAISYISSLLQTERFRHEDIWLSHSGDHIVQHVEGSLDEATRQLLQVGGCLRQRLRSESHV